MPRATCAGSSAKRLRQEVAQLPLRAKAPRRAPRLPTRPRDPAISVATAPTAPTPQYPSATLDRRRAAASSRGRSRRYPRKCAPQTGALAGRPASARAHSCTERAAASRLPACQNGERHSAAAPTHFSRLGVAGVDQALWRPARNSLRPSLFVRRSGSARRAPPRVGPGEVDELHAPAGTVRTPWLNCHPRPLLHLVVFAGEVRCGHRAHPHCPG